MNNDRFKFRAWNAFLKEEDRVMVYDVQKLNSYPGGYQKEDIDHLPFGYQDIYNNDRDFQNLIDTPAWTIMQCTGIKDKNGNLMYEGDILNTIFGFDGEISVVSFNNKSCGGVLGWNVLDKNGEPLVYYYGQSPNGRSEIIGNIYEHKHLLEND